MRASPPRPTPVSSNTARKLLLGRATFWTGVDTVLLTDDLAKVPNVPQAAGLLVQHPRG